MLGKYVPLIFLFGLGSWAGDPQAPNRQKEFDRTVIQLRTQSVVDVISEELAGEGSTVQYPVEEDKLAEKLKDISEKIFAQNPDALARSRKLSWKGIAHTVLSGAQNLGVEFRAKARVLGMDVGLVYLVGIVVDNIMPFVLTGIGQPGIAAAFEILPTGPMETGSYVALKKLLHRHKTMAEYGGKESYRYYANLETATLKKLHLHHDTDLLVSLAEPGSAVILSDDGTVQNILRFLHPKTARLTYRELQKIARAHGMTKAQLKDLSDDFNDNSMRSSVLFEWIQKHLSENELEVVHARYPESFVKTRISPKIAPLLDWATSALDVHNCDQLVALVRKAPAGISVPLVMETWQRVLLPSVADTFSGTRVQKFYKMSRESLSLEIMARISTHQGSKTVPPVWDQKWDDLLLDAVAKLCSKEAVVPEAILNEFQHSAPMTAPDPTCH